VPTLQFFPASATAYATPIFWWPELMIPARLDKIVNLSRENTTSIFWWWHEVSRWVKCLYASQHSSSSYARCGCSDFWVEPRIFEPGIDFCKLAKSGSLGITTHQLFFYTLSLSLLLIHTHVTLILWTGTIFDQPSHGSDACFSGEGSDAMRVEQQAKCREAKLYVFRPFHSLNGSKVLWRSLQAWQFAFEASQLLRKRKNLKTAHMLHSAHEDTTFCSMCSTICRHIIVCTD
jgi:hypothetical protein